MSVNTRKVCAPCSKINYLAFFTSNPPGTTELCTAQHLKDCHLCPLCVYIRKSVGEEILDRARKTKIVIRQSILEAQEYLRTADIAPFYRLSIARKDQRGEVQPVCKLDLCNGHPDHSEEHPAQNSSLRMVRRLRSPRFDQQMVLKWLEGCEEPQRLFTGENSIQDGGKLETLMSEGRFRVLNVYSGEVAATQSRSHYVALSYVWGRPQNRDQYLSRSAPGSIDVAWTVDMESLPKTIQDACMLVRALGEVFIWIDSICIDQSSTQDKAAIVPAMDSIYSEAYLTIVAASGRSADAGLSGLRTDREADKEPIHIYQNRHEIKLAPACPGLTETLEASLWEKRGWTYQEHVLSQRCVFFTKGEVFFSGDAGVDEREAYALEDTQRNHSDKIRRTGKNLTTRDYFKRCKYHRFDGISMWQRYHAAVASYSRKELTNAGDRMDAFTGALNFFARGQQSLEAVQALSGLMAFSIKDEVYGRYTDNFVQSLLWQPEQPALSPGDRIWFDSTGHRSLPSWSWVGWRGAVNVDNTLWWPNWYGSCFHAVLPRLMNATNIQCCSVSNDDEMKWPFDPTPLVLSPSQGVILHLWLPVLRCVLESEVDRPASGDISTFSILFRGAKIGRVAVHIDFLPSDNLQGPINDEIPEDASQPSEDPGSPVDSEASQENMATSTTVKQGYQVQMISFGRKLDTWARSRFHCEEAGILMLVRNKGECTERVALSDLVLYKENIHDRRDLYEHVRLI